MTAQHVVVGPAPAQVAAAIAPPKLAESSGAVFTEWSASRSAQDEGGAVLLSACVATPIPGWVEDMRPVVEARTVGLAGAAASKITSAAVDVRPGDDGLLDLRPASDLGGPVIGRARTFVGFDASRVHTCFAICAEPTSNPTRPCDRAVVEARLDGSRAPPPPGAALRSATWAVHHPRPAMIAGAGLILLTGVLAVVVRRRPRATMTR